jgi:TPR repeat protein
MRWLPLLVLIVVAACSNPGSTLSPDEAFAEAHAAMMAREASRAMVHLRSAAQQGHLEAAALLAEAYAHGRLSPSVGYEAWEDRGGAVVLPITVLPGQARRWTRRFEELLADSLAAGNPAAMMMQANRLLYPYPNESTPAEREEALALLTALAQGSHVDAALSLAIQLRESDPLAAERWVMVAVEQGHPQACYIRTWFVDDTDLDFYSAAGFERYLTALADCPTPIEERASIMSRLDDLRAQADEGNLAAESLLDSLEAMGALDHYPALADGPDA